MRFRSVAYAATLASFLPLAASAQAPDFGSPPSGQIPILFDDHHVYARPSTLRHGRLLAALVRGGNLLVPLRSMFEQLGGNVQYDPLTRSTTVRNAQTTVEVTVGVPEVRINGDVRPLDVAPLVYRGNVLVPVRVIAEALGAYVEYEPRARAVAIRLNVAPPPATRPVPAPSATQSPEPIPAAPRATVPPGPPIPVQPPNPETYVVADVALSPRTANAFAPNVSGSTGESFDARAASEFSILDLPLEIDGEYARYTYGHPAGQVTSIGGFGAAFVSAFDAHDSEFAFDLGAQINPEKFYLDASYVLLNNSYGYPSLGGLGIGFEKLPVLERRFSYDASFFYYPNVSGGCGTSACPPTVDTLSYTLLRYQAGVTYSLGPAFLEAGYRGDDGRKKAAAPVGFTHAGIFAGLGAHF
jgi:hypothetical protein